VNRVLPKGFERGPMQGRGIIGEVTEALHRYLLDGWETDQPPPRIEEDISFVPKDREEILYVYMYRCANNTALMNSKRLREARISKRNAENPDDDEVYYERPPLYLDLYYLISVHSKFRSDAERLLGWSMLRLHEATHLVYRPRRYTLPDGRVVDSRGKPWKAETLEDDVVMEKVALALVDDLTVGDAINFFTIHEAPYRPYLTYRARCAMEGALIQAPSATTIRSLPLETKSREGTPGERPGGRLGRIEMRPRSQKVPYGPEGHNFRPLEGDDDNNESED
jgi:hypothetical protein